MSTESRNFGDLYAEKTSRRVQSLDLGPFIIRVASWPVETIDKLCSPRLTEEVDRWLEREKIVCRDSVRLSEFLHTLIPSIQDNVFRATVLSFRRCIYRSADPVPNSLFEPLLSSKVVPLELKELIRSHLEARVALTVQWRELKLAYKSSLAAEQNELRRITSDSAFRKALYLASPMAFQALKTGRHGLRERQKRQLDLTLHSYVMRSVGRATPNGLWAGVVIETPSDGDKTPIRADWAPRRVIFSPDLSPFIVALQAMARQDPWRKEIPLRLNPTLFRNASSLWQFGDYREGIWHVFQTVDHPVLTALLSLFPEASTRLPQEIQDHLIARKAVISAAEAEKSIDQMLKLGILGSTLEMADIYDDPWHALEGAIAEVPENERCHWNRCLRGLERICGQLSFNYEAISPDDLRDHMVAAQDCVNELLVRYGAAPVPKERHVMIADTRASLRFSISSSLRSRIERALRTYWAFDWYGLGEVQAIIDRQREFGELQATKDISAVQFVRQKEAAKAGVSCESSSCSPKRPERVGDEICRPAFTIEPWEAMLSSIAKPTIKVRAEDGFRRWYRDLEAVFAHRLHRLQLGRTNSDKSPLGPGSALVLLDISGQDCILRIGSVTPDPCLFYSRFNLLFREKGESVDSFYTWYRESLRKSEAAFPNLQFADLAVRVEKNPNAASRPRMAKRMLDGLNRDGTFFSSVCIRLDTSGRPNLYVPEQYSAIIPMLHSAVSLDGSDPFSQCLYSVSCLLGRPSLMRPLPRFAAEIDKWYHLPRLYLDRTTVLSPERWTPPRSVGKELARSSGLDRYITWRRFVRSKGLPRLVYGKYGMHQTQMLVAVDSILAVENLGKTLAAHSSTFLLQEAFPSPRDSWVRDSDGRHYVAELAIAWQGEFSFWRDYLGDPNQSQTVVGRGQKATIKSRAASYTPIVRLDIRESSERTLREQRGSRDEGTGGHRQKR